MPSEQVVPSNGKIVNFIEIFFGLDFHKAPELSRRVFVVIHEYLLVISDLFIKRPFGRFFSPLSPGIRNGVVLVGMITDDQTPAGDSGEVYATRYGNGASVAVDTAGNAMAISLPAGGTVSVDCQGGATLKGDLKVEGNINATGEVADKTGTLQAVRETFNQHDHKENGDGGGTTNPPNQKM